MPTRIVFSTAGGDATVLDVEEEPDAVHHALIEAKGAAVILTKRGTDRTDVYVNPATIAYWGQGR